MEKEYKVSLFSKIVPIVMGAIFTCFAAISVLEGNYGNIIDVLLILSIFAVFIVNQFKRRIITSADSFTKVNLFDTKTISLKNIQGYRYKGKGLKIYYSSDPMLSIFFNDSDYADSMDLKAWLTQNLINLDEQEREQEYAEMLKQKKAIAAQMASKKKNIDVTKPAAAYNLNEVETETPALDDDIDDVAHAEQLDEDLESSFKIMIAYDMVAVVAFLCNLVSHNWIVLSFVIIYPFIGLIIIATSKGLIRLCPKETSPKHSLFIGVIICCAILCLTFEREETPFLFYNFVVLVFTTIGVFTGMAWYFDKAERAEPYTARRLWLPVIGILYGFGAVIQMEHVWGHFVK